MWLDLDVAEGSCEDAPSSWQLLQLKKGMLTEGSCEDAPSSWQLLQLEKGMLTEGSCEDAPSSWQMLQLKKHSWTFSWRGLLHATHLLSLYLILV